MLVYFWKWQENILGAGASCFVTTILLAAVIDMMSVKKSEETALFGGEGGWKGKQCFPLY